MSRRNRHPGDRNARLIVLILGLLGLAALGLLVLGMVLAGNSSGS